MICQGVRRDIDKLASQPHYCLLLSCIVLSIAHFLGSTVINFNWQWWLFDNEDNNSHVFFHGFERAEVVVTAQLL